MRSLTLMKNFLYLSGAELVTKVVTFAAIAYLARIAGPVGYGYVEFASSVLLCAGLIVDQGFGMFGAREIAKAPQRTVALVSEVVVARFILAIVAYAIVLAFTLLLDRPPVVTGLLLIYGFSLLATPLLLQWVFQGHDRMKTVAFIQLIRQTVFAAVIFALVRQESQIWFAAVAEVAGVGSAAVYGIWMYHRHIRGPLVASLHLSRRLFREGVPIGLSQMFWMIRMFGATVIVGLIAPAQDVGFFGGAMRILVALHAFVWLYYFNLLPSLSQAWQRDDGYFSVLIFKSLRGVAWLAIVGGVIWVLAAPLVMTGFYGPAFAPAGETLQWLAGVFVIAALSGHYRYGLIAAGQQTMEMAAQALGTALAVLLIPVAYANAGPMGAGVALVVAELAVWLSTWWWAHERLHLDWHLRLLIRPLAALVLLMGLLRLLPFPSEIARIALAMAWLALLSLLLDAVVRERCRQFAMATSPWFRRHLERRAQGAAQ